MFPIDGLTICDDSMAHVLGERIDTDAVGQLVHLTVIINNGKFNSQTNTFDWNQVEINHPFLKNAKGEIFAADIENTAWSQDGKVGYIYLIGIDSANSQRSYQPIVYKSLDKGVTWKLLPVYNFKNLTSLTQYIPGTSKDSTLKKPFFTSGSLNAIVDAKNNLHIFSNVYGASSDNNDSLNLSYGYNLIFDVYTTNDSTWNADLLDILSTQDVLPEDLVFFSSYTSLGWDHRLQISRSYDGVKLFFVWTDSDPQYAQVSIDGIHYINNVPNLYIYGKDVITGKKTGIYSITGGSSIDGQAFWHYVSEITLKVFNNYIVPVSISPILDIYTTNPDKPITHYYLPGVEFSEDMFVVNPMVFEHKTPVADVSQNYPNPLSSSSTVVVNLTQPSELSLEIDDLLGQKVYEESLGKVSADAHTFTIYKNDLKPGIYFYTVRADQYAVTKKMIVE